MRRVDMVQAGVARGVPVMARAREDKLLESARALTEKFDRIRDMIRYARQGRRQDAPEQAPMWGSILQGVELHARAARTRAGSTWVTATTRR